MLQDKFSGFQFKSMTNFFKYFYFLFAFIAFIAFLVLSAGNVSAKETNYGFTMTPSPLQSTDTSLDLNIDKLEQGHRYILALDVNNPDNYNPVQIRFITGINSTTIGGTWTKLKSGATSDVVLNANSSKVIIKNICSTYQSKENASDCSGTFGAGTRYFMLVDITNVCKNRDPNAPCLERGDLLPSKDALKDEL